MTALHSLEADTGTAPFAPHHREIRAQVRGWMAEHVAPFVDEWEAAREFPRELYPKAGAAGLLGWKYAPEDGGCGPDFLADIIVSEEMPLGGSGGVAAGLGATKDLAPFYVARFGTAEQRARWLVPAARGEAVAGLAVTEPGAGSDVASISTKAVREGDGWRIDGTKTFCTNGARADWILVAARTSDEPGHHAISLLVVPTDTPGFSSSRIPTLGWRTSQTGHLTLDGVHVPDDNLLGEPGSGFVMIMQSFQWERLALAVGSAAAAMHNLAAARKRLPTTLVGQWTDLVAQVAAARALAYGAVTDTLAGKDALTAVSAAKWLACDLDVETADLRLRVADEADAPRAERALRDARLGPIGGGAREVMAEIIGKTMGLGR